MTQITLIREEPKVKGFNPTRSILAAAYRLGHKVGYRSCRLVELLDVLIPLGVFCLASVVLHAFY